jgi:hypothetical protein
MSVIRVLGISIAALAGMACSSDSVGPLGNGLTYATASFTCGPADGPATAIYLSATPIGLGEPSAPFVRMYVSVGVDELAGHVWGVQDKARSVGAWLQPILGGESIPASAGTLVVSSVGADRSVEGLVDFDFPDGSHVHSSFHAAWVQSNIICV